MQDCTFIFLTYGYTQLIILRLFYWACLFLFCSLFWKFLLIALHVLFNHLKSISGVQRKSITSGKPHFKSIQFIFRIFLLMNSVRQEIMKLFLTNFNLKKKIIIFMPPDFVLPKPSCSFLHPYSEPRVSAGARLSSLWLKGRDSPWTFANI